MIIIGNFIIKVTPVMTLANKILKASYKDCPVLDRKAFKQSSCLLPISVLQPVHEGEKLKATIELIGRTFKTCTILIDDTVQRHTLKISYPALSDSELYQIAYHDGDLWLNRNKDIYEKLPIPYNIIRWDIWRLHHNFTKQLQVVTELYNINTAYKHAVDLTIAEYLRRSKKNGKIFDYEFAAAICLDYLKEECAAMTLWIENSYQFELYPTGRNKAMTATYTHLIAPNYPKLLRSVALRFKKY